MMNISPPDGRAAAILRAAFFAIVGRKHLKNRAHSGNVKITGKRFIQKACGLHHDPICQAWLAYGCIFVLMTPTGAVLVAQVVLIVSEDGETAFAALCIVVG